MNVSSPAEALSENRFLTKNSLKNMLTAINPTFSLKICKIRNLLVGLDKIHSFPVSTMGKTRRDKRRFRRAPPPAPKKAQKKETGTKPVPVF